MIFSALSRIQLPVISLFFVALLAGCNVTQTRTGTTTTPVTSVGLGSQGGSLSSTRERAPKEMNLSSVVKRSAASVVKKSKAEKLNKSLLLYVDRLRNSTRDPIDTENATNQSYNFV